MEEREPEMIVPLVSEALLNERFHWRQPAREPVDMRARQLRHENERDARFRTKCSQSWTLFCNGRGRELSNRCQAFPEAVFIERGTLDSRGLDLTAAKPGTQIGKLTLERCGHAG